MNTMRRIMAVDGHHGGTWASLDLSWEGRPAGLEVGVIDDPPPARGENVTGLSRLFDHARVELDLLLWETSAPTWRRGVVEGVVKSVLCLYRPLYQVVEPMEWRREFGLSGTKQDADASVAMAMDLIGKVGGFNSMRPDEADAILLAWWGRKYP